MKLLPFLALALAACTGGGVPFDPDLERMINQAKGNPYRETSYFPDGKVMQTPPAGTVPRDRIVGDPLLTEGMQGDQIATSIPIPVTRDLLNLGQERFNIYCAPCHGLQGDGVSEVARHMSLRKPPSLVDMNGHVPGEKLIHGAHGEMFAPGFVFRAITYGWGVMPTYGADLDVKQRWAVVAYVNALGLSHGVALDNLPAPIREEATRQLQQGQAPQGEGTPQ